MMQRSLPRKLRVLRAERGLTLRQVEALTGVAKETLSDLERGKRRPHDTTLARLAEGYGVGLDELMDLEEAELAGKYDAPKTARQPLDIKAAGLENQDPPARFNILEIQPVLEALERDYGLPEHNLRLIVVDKDEAEKYEAAKRQGRSPLAEGA
jgi:transcriptional regulator with XRE-family HTH domain